MESEPSRGDRTDAGLRTVGFRLRGIQRLMSVRVQQENRRLEVDGERKPLTVRRHEAGDDRWTTPGTVRTSHG